VERYVDAVVLGLVQGLTEFLPISSSGHLALSQALLGWEDASANLTCNIAVHVGSLAAVLVFVRRQIHVMFTRRPRLVLVLGVATLPLLLAVLVKDAVESFSGNIAVVGLCLLGTAGILMLARRLDDGDGEAPRLPLPRALAIGFAQLLAVLPGISRSGSTLVAGLGMRLERDEALRFAFLMAVPAIGGAALFDVLDGGLDRIAAPGAVAAGVVVSFVASLAAMKLMVGVVRRRRLPLFALYCAILGLTALVVGLRGPPSG